MTNPKSDANGKPRRGLYRQIVDAVSSSVGGKAAKQIDVLQDELAMARTEIDHLISDANQLRETAAAAQHELARLAQERDALHASIQGAKRQIEALSSERAELQRALEAAGAETRALAGERQAAIDDYRTLLGQRNELQRKLDAMEADLKRTAGEREAAVGDYRTTLAQRNELQRKLDAAEAENRRIAGELQAAINDYREMLQRRNELQRQLDEAGAAAKRLAQEQSAAQEQIDLLRRERDSLKEAIEVERAAERAAVEERDANDDLLRQRDELQQRLDAAEKEVRRIAGEREAAISDYEKVRSELVTIRTDLDRTKSAHAAVAAERDKLHAERDTLWSMVQGEFARQLDRLKASNETLNRENQALRDSLRQAEEDGEILSRTDFSLEAPRFPAGFVGLGSAKDEANLHRYLEGLRQIYTMRADPRTRGAYIADMLCAFGRTMHFLDDEPFVAAFSRQAAGADDTVRLWRLHTLVWAARTALRLDGDFVECGVFEGFSSAVICETLNFATAKKKFVLYDTFAGLSDRFSSPEEHAAVRGRGYDRPTLYEDVCRRFSPYPNVRVVRGVVPEVLGESAPSRIAFLHLDMDAAKAEVGALEALYGRVTPGGVIVLDDFGRVAHVEQHLGVRAWAEREQLAICELPTGQGLLVKPASRRRPQREDAAAGG